MVFEPVLWNNSMHWHFPNGFRTCSVEQLQALMFSLKLQHLVQCYSVCMQTLMQAFKVYADTTHAQLGHVLKWWTKLLVNLNNIIISNLMKSRLGISLRAFIVHTLARYQFWFKLHANDYNPLVMRIVNMIFMDSFLLNKNFTATSYLDLQNIYFKKKKKKWHFDSNSSLLQN